MIIPKKEIFRMNELGFTKDTTPYLVFKCNKCKQYSYVKVTQKTKKCLRCGHSHQVKLIINSGMIVNGMTAAVNRVKELQNQLGDPQFRTESEFIMAPRIREQSSQLHKKSRMIYNDGAENYLEAFNVLLRDLSHRYSSFPLYLIEAMASDYKIPLSVLKDLIFRGITNKILVKDNNNHYSVRSND